MMPTRQAHWWVAAGLALLLAVGWLLNKQVVYTYLLLTEPEFKLTVEPLRWSDPHSQRVARTQMACSGKLTAVRLLHMAGIHDDADGMSGLVCAVRNDDFEMARTLVRLGADVNRPAQTTAGGSQLIRTGQSLTPLAHAVQAGRTVMVDWLVTQGAKPDGASETGVAAIHIAASRHCLPCVEHLKRHGASLNLSSPVLPLVAWFDASGVGRPVSVDALERLVALGMSPTDAGADGRSALHAAAARAQLRPVEWLLAHGADATRSDQRAMTPLMYAAYHAEAVPENDAWHQRQQVVSSLLARTPVLSAASSAPSTPPAMPAMAPPPPEAGWSLAMFAARQPAFRRAAKLQGKAFDYGAAPVGQTPWHGLPAQAVRDATREMSDDELRSALWVNPRTDQEASGLPYIAARGGWVPELRRMVQEGLLTSTRTDPAKLCALLEAAAVGSDDPSPAREASWEAVTVLLDAGLSSSTCAPPALERVHKAVAARSPVQILQWQVRTGDDRRGA